MSARQRRKKWKTKKEPSVKDLEDGIFKAIDEHDKKKVSSILDHLNRRDVTEGFAVQAAKNFLSGRNGR